MTEQNGRNGRGSHFSYCEGMTLEQANAKGLPAHTKVLVIREPGSLSGEVLRARFERLDFQSNGHPTWKASSLP